MSTPPRNRYRYYNTEHYGGNRIKVLLRDRNRCRICSEYCDPLTGETSVIVYHRKGPGKNGMRDLLTICRRCRSKINHLIRQIKLNEPPKDFGTAKYLSLALERVHSR